jgi:hypothetical protein
MHMESLFLAIEHFTFENMILDMNATNLNLGKSTALIAQMEYVLTELSYLSPFVGYESWNRFDHEHGYTKETMVYGINWYLRGNSTKVGFNAAMTEFGDALGDRDVVYRLTSQLRF